MPKPDKLKITAFTKSDFATQKAEPSTYTARVNPVNYTRTYSITYDKKATPGAAATDVKFDTMPAQTVTFDLLFDATGVIEGSPTDLDAEIDAFRQIVYDYNGEIDSPYFLEIRWGKFSFRACLTGMTLTYTLFQSDGKPLRATAKLTFIEQMDPLTAKLRMGRSSPDLTHHVLVRAGDTLPALTYRMYGKASYYPEVARANQLVDFRNLQPGTLLSFPPLS